MHLEEWALHWLRKLKEGPCLQRSGQRKAGVLVAGGEVDFGKDRPIG